MVETVVLKLGQREGSGTAASRRLRKNGMIPVVVYGHGADPVSATVNLHDITLELQRHNRLFDVDLDGKTAKLLIKEIQYDHLYDKIIHMDFTRVNIDERVTVSVPIVLRGALSSEVEQGVVDQLLSDIELECLVTDIPGEIRVKIGDMQVGDSILAQDLELSSGVKLITDPETVIVTVRVMAEEPEEEEAVEGEQGSEPEVISRESESDEESEE